MAYLLPSEWALQEHIVPLRVGTGASYGPLILKLVQGAPIQPGSSHLQGRHTVERVSAY